MGSIGGKCIEENNGIGAYLNQPQRGWVKPPAAKNTAG